MSSKQSKGGDKGKGKETSTPVPNLNTLRRPKKKVCACIVYKQHLSTVYNIIFNQKDTADKPEYAPTQVEVVKKVKPHSVGKFMALSNFLSSLFSC